jgi:O-antigen/teichoic acid export membrane protein
VTTVFRDDKQDVAPASSGSGIAGPSRRSRPRLPVTWPLAVVFTGFPLLWVLGLSAVIWTIMVGPLLVALIWRQRTKAPLPIMLWFAFTSWVLMSGLQLESGTKIITFTYRLTLYVCGGLLFLYVYNLPRSRRLDLRVLRIMTTFWMIVVIGGYVGILGGSHTFPALLEFLIPHHLRSQPFVQELVQPVLANVVNFLGFPVPRPSAPFPYTNNWGGNIAVLTPVALAALSVTRAGLRRRTIVFFLLASLVPMIVSLNRGMFLSLGVGLLYVAVRLAARGRVSTLVSLLVLMIGLGVIVALTPLGHLVIANLSSSHGNSNTTRISVSQQSIAGANQSPIFGWGEPQQVTGQGGTPPIGSQGQLWMVLYSDGYIATALFIGFFLAVLWQTRRAAGTAGLWLHAVPLIALTQITVYGWLPVELQVVMVIAALAYRRCWGPVPTVKAHVPARLDAAPDLLEPQALDWDAPPGRRDRALHRREAVPGLPEHVVPDFVPELTGSREWPGRPTPRTLVPGPRPVPTAGSPANNANNANNEPGTPAGGVSGTSVVVARGSLINLVAMVAGAAMSFGLVVLVSRWLQPHGAGEFYELVALFTILSNTFELGADTGLTRWISRARAIGGLEDVRRIVAIAVIPVTLIGVAAAAALWMAAPQVSRLFLHGVPVAAGATDIRLLAPLVPLGALSAVIVDGVRGFGRMWPYLAIEGIGKPAVRIVAVTAVLMAGLDLHAAIIVWGIPVIVGLVAGTVIFIGVLRKEVPGGTGTGFRRRPGAALAPSHGVTGGSARPLSRIRVPADVPRRPGRSQFPPTPDLDATVELPVVFDPVPLAWENVGETDLTGDGDARSQVGAWDLLNTRSRKLAAEFWAFTGPRAFQATFQVTVLFLDVLIVGALASTYQAGIYSAVSKLAILGAFALEGNRLAIGPQLSAMLGRREHGRAAELYQTATRSLVLLTFPLYLVLATFPAVILGIFGSRYTSGAPALTVLCLAMLVNLGTGNVTVVLLMGGKSSWSAINAVAALIANIGLNLLLIPHIGILGAAIAWSASIAIDNVAAMIEVRLVMGMASFGPGYWQTAGITLTCFGVTGIAARLILGQTVIALLVALLAGMVSYALVLYTNRAQLQLSELAAALRPGQARPPAGTARAGTAVPVRSRRAGPT